MSFDQYGGCWSYSGRQAVRQVMRLKGPALDWESTMRKSLSANQFIHLFLTGLNGALWTGMIALALLAIYILSPFGTRARDAARERTLEEIRMESEAFCEKFGMPAATEQHLQCVFELGKIRSNEDERTGGSVDGFF